MKKGIKLNDLFDADYCRSAYGKKARELTIRMIELVIKLKKLCI